MIKREVEMVVGQPVEVATLNAVAEHIASQAELELSSYICFTTAYMLVEASRDASIREAYAASHMILPDGVPVAWCLRSFGHAHAECISGPRLMPVLLREAGRRGITVGFYGGRESTLSRMTAALQRSYPLLKVTYDYSPPFRPLTQDEQLAVIENIKQSGTQMLFIGLGSPKQDLWMHDNAAQTGCVCLGVGAAFEFLSGEKFLPPRWIQRMGLTWLVRLCREPRRLLRRNLYSPIFVFLFLKQRLFGAPEAPSIVAYQDTPEHPND